MNLLMPPQIAKLRTDKHGRPVPWFVADVDGVPDFRIIAAGKIEDALKFDQCWICGERRGAYSAFVIGPMCAVNRTTAEPPCHLSCAEYAAAACPFLATPQMRRRDSNLPAGTVEPGGVMIRRNPGVALVWVTKRFDVWFPTPGRGPLITIGDPTSVHWYAEGREATRIEVVTSMASGLPELRQIATDEGPAAVRQLDAQVRRAQALLPEPMMAGR